VKIARSKARGRDGVRGVGKLEREREIGSKVLVDEAECSA